MSSITLKYKIIGVRVSVLRLIQLGHVVKKTVEAHFRLLGTNGFHAKVKNKTFTATGSRCRQTLKN